MHSELVKAALINVAGSLASTLTAVAIAIMHAQALKPKRRRKKPPVRNP
jgi:hypothetical protein